ncbi:MAG: CHC2 zinc finger domain-containing protein, partial [Thermomicrobiales bacterium]
REVLDNSIEWLMAEIGILQEEQKRRAHAEAARQRAAADGRPRRDLGERFAAARELDCAKLLRALTGQPGRGNGQNRMFSCPLHEDRSPSLVAYPPGRGWYCFSCHQGGDAVALLTAITPMSRMDALRLLERGAVSGITPPDPFATTPEVH